MIKPEDICIDPQCMNLTPNHSHKEFTYKRYLHEDEEMAPLTDQQLLDCRYISDIIPKSLSQEQKEINQLKETGYKLEIYDDLVWATKDSRRVNPRWI